METETIIESLREMGLLLTSKNLARHLRRDYRTEDDVRWMLSESVRAVFTARLKSQARSGAMILAVEALAREIDWQDVADRIADSTIEEAATT